MSRHNPQLSWPQDVWTATLVDQISSWSASNRGWMPKIEPSNLLKYSPFPSVRFGPLRIDKNAPIRRPSHWPDAYDRFLISSEGLSQFEYPLAPLDRKKTVSRSLIKHDSRRSAQAFEIGKFSCSNTWTLCIGTSIHWSWSGAWSNFLNNLSSRHSIPDILTLTTI